MEIVANLLENAFRYSPAGQSVGLSLLDDGLAVWDSGAPIQESDRERIFQRGYRGAAGQERSGTGLGLALARVGRQHAGALDLLIEPSCLARAAQPRQRLSTQMAVASNADTNRMKASVSTTVAP